MCDTLDLGWTRFTTRILSLPKGVFGFVEDTNIAFVVFPSCKYFRMVGNKMSRCLFVASRSHLALLLLGLGNLKCTESL